MFASLVRWSRTTYRGSRGSGPGASGKTSARSSPRSRSTVVAAIEAGRVFKRSQRGLFDGAVLQSGNSVPKSRQKTARTWEPNIQRKWIWSDLLARSVRLRVTTRALRTIRKQGGLDAYLTLAKDSKLGDLGKKLRSRMGERALRLQERQRAGHPPPLPPLRSAGAAAAAAAAAAASSSSSSRL